MAFVTPDRQLGVIILRAFMFKNLYYGWWIVIACFIISLYVSGITFLGFTAFFEPIHREFGWSYTQISFAASLRGLEMGIFAPIVGFLVDRFGSRKLLLSGAIITGIGYILLGFTQSLLMFYLCILFVSFGAGGCTAVVTMAAVGVWFRKNVGTHSHHAPPQQYRNVKSCIGYSGSSVAFGQYRRKIRFWMVR